MASKDWFVCRLLAFCLLLVVCMGRSPGHQSKAPAHNFTLTSHGLNFTQAKADKLASIYHSRRQTGAKPTASATRTSVPTKPAGALNVTSATLQQARSLVAAAHASQAAYNKDLLAHPRFNTYRSRHGNSTRAAKKRAKRAVTPQPSFSDEVLEAIKLVGQADALAMAQNNTLLKPIPKMTFTNTTRGPNRGYSNFKPSGTTSKRDNPPYWVGQMDHLGTQPFGGDSSYQVWRNVKDYGAVGDGVTDDTAAINRAISDGNRCGVNCLSSSVKGAIVYFPVGTYLVSKPIISFYNTQLVGEMGPSGTGEDTGYPTILAASSFTGFGVITSDVYLPDGVSEWYIEQSNFYRQIRNFNIDLRHATLDQIAGIHWQVAQATSIANVYIFMTDKSTSTQVGIWAENGSGGWLSDIVFTGGQYGFLGGNQQYTVTNLYFHQCANGVGLIWDWAWTWANLLFESCDVAINLNPPGASQADPVGSIYLLDSDFVTCGTMIYTFPFRSSEQGTTVFTFDNIHFVGNSYFLGFTDGTVTGIDVTSDGNIDFATIGDIEVGAALDGFYTIDVGNRSSELALPWTGYTGYAQQPYRRRHDVDASNFYNAKWYAYGDGVTDDTQNLQDLLFYCSEFNLILFLPAGSYMISSTLFIPSNTYIVGEVWSQLVAYGSYFEDEANPQVMLYVGNPGDQGVVEMQDLLFTSVGNLAGLDVMQWNIQGSSPAAAAMWDCHFRIGGALGTQLQVAQCPKLSGGIKPECIAGSSALIVAPWASPYFENMWVWIADHDIDDAANTQIDIYFGRGIIDLSTNPAWFWGTASEHSVLFQYGIFNASNTFMSMIQTESPYFQGYAATQAPLPFDQNIIYNTDPVWDMCGVDTTTCNMAWALLVQHSTDITILGTGLYSWFQNYDENCVNSNNCQTRLVNIYNVGNLMLNHVVTIGAVEVITPAISNTQNTILYASDHVQALEYPWWTAVAFYGDSIGQLDPSVNPSPVKNGWVSFGDSYAAGIGAGTPLDTVDDCKRGTGSYTAILNQIIRFSSNVPSEHWQPLACSGETAEQFLEGQGTNQLSLWTPTDSDLATVSYTGNDLGFANIVSHCIMGYPRGSQDSECPNDIANAQSILDRDRVSELVQDVLDAIFQKANTIAGKERFIVYWTGYPEFFAIADTVCDSCYFNQYIWAGQYLTTQLRGQLNYLSTQVNQQISFAIQKYNAGLSYPKAVYVGPDELGIYSGHRFCEPGVKETLKTEAGQKNVAFFYNDGWDDIPSTDEGFQMPPKYNSGAPDGWSVETDNSAACSDAGADGLPDPLDDMLCSVAKAVANGSVSAQDVANSGGDGLNLVGAPGADGSVSVSDFRVRFTKMFHPKTRANWHIAQAVNAAFRLN
ncbi:hypothetical protein VTK56DRAFT_2078 [Thermocarpiscus australiensis]